MAELTPWQRRQQRLARLTQLEEPEPAPAATLEQPQPEPQPEPPEPAPEPAPEPEPELPMPRVFACSDLHVDYRENMRWVEAISDRSFRGDALLIAGDVTDDLEKLKDTLRLLKTKFAHVFYLPGNHDLWIRGGLKKWNVGPISPLTPPLPPPANSLVKLEQILTMCDEIGVYTSPRRLRGVWVVPLLAWYHAGFDTEPDISGWEGIPPIEDALMDYQLVKFPAGVSARKGDDTAAKHFDVLNERLAETALRSLGGQPGADSLAAGDVTWSQRLHAQITADRRASDSHGVISFSHFLPR